MKNVWIVDDDRSIRWVLEKALQKADIPCKTFSEAESVLQAIKKEQPALILSDIHMPGKSGLEMLSEIKKSYPKLPIIIMTAYSDLDSAVASFQGGAFEYLPKPFDIDKAIELVRRATEENEEEEQTPSEETASEIIGHAGSLPRHRTFVSKQGNRSVNRRVRRRQRSGGESASQTQSPRQCSFCRNQYGGNSERLNGNRALRT